MILRRAIFFILWVLSLAYTWWMAPAGNEGYLQQLMKMDSPDPLVLMVFSLLGMYPIAFTILFLNQDDSRVPAWPFALGSFGLGAFAIMPYFFLSSTEEERALRISPPIIKLLNTTGLHNVLVLGTLALFGYGWLQGDFSNYQEAFVSSRFVHVMTVDFFLLTGISVFAIQWDQRKRGILNHQHWLGLIPVIGLLLYLRLTYKQRGKMNEMDHNATRRC